MVQGLYIVPVIAGCAQHVNCKVFVKECGVEARIIASSVKLKEYMKFKHRTQTFPGHY